MSSVKTPNQMDNRHLRCRDQAEVPGLLERAEIDTKGRLC